MGLVLVSRTLICFSKKVRKFIDDNKTDEMLIDRCNSFVRLLLYQELKIRFKDEIILETLVLENKNRWVPKCFTRLWNCHDFAINFIIIIILSYDPSVYCKIQNEILCCVQLATQTGYPLHVKRTDCIRFWSIGEAFKLKQFSVGKLNK